MGISNSILKQPKFFTSLSHMSFLLKEHICLETSAHTHINFNNLQQSTAGLYRMIARLYQVREYIVMESKYGTI